MTLDEIIIQYDNQARMIDFLIDCGIPKYKAVKLFDLLDKASQDNIPVGQKRMLASSIEESIASIAEDSFDEDVNNILIEIKKETQNLKS